MRKATNHGGRRDGRSQGRGRKPQRDGGRPQRRDGRSQRDGGRPQRRGAPRVQKEISREPIITKITPFGLYMYHDTELIKKSFWGKNPDKNAEKYINVDEEVKKLNNTVPIKARRVSERIFKEPLREFALANGFSETEFKNFIQKFTVELTKLKIKYGFKREKLIIQAVSNVDEVTRMLNVFYERLSEWYGFYFPEAVREIEDMERFAEIVGKKRHEKSMGYDLESEDLKSIKMAGEEMRNLITYKNKLSYYIEDLMNEKAPNLAIVAGHILGAKLIAAAGSIERLSKMTASTIQLLGAEKALFRHLRKGSKPPKYGLILQHSMMKKVAPTDRGKFARTLSGKLSIAARVDYNSKGKEKVAKLLIKDLEDRINRLS